MPHQWERIDQGVAQCVRCDAIDGSLPCVPLKDVAKPSNSDTLRLAIDRLSRQMGRMQIELSQLKNLI
jgi:hypothetical protein